MEFASPLSYYEKEKTAGTAALLLLKQQRNRIGWARVGVVAGAALLLYILWPMSLPWALLLMGAALAIFLFLVNRSLALNQQILLEEKSIAILEEEIALQRSPQSHRYDGAALAPKQHAYANDLDAFGQGSLFQYLHRSSSEPGHRTVASWLLQPAGNETLLQRQQAAKELAALPAYSVRLQAIGQLESIRLQTATVLQQWLETKPLFGQAYWKPLAKIFPVLSLGSLLAYSLDWLSAPLFYTLVAVYVIFAFSISRKVQHAYLQLNKILPQLNTLSQLLETIETPAFQSPALQQLQDRLKTQAAVPGNTRTATAGGSASSQIKNLRRILDRFDYRLNPLVFIPLNTFLLWDLQQILQLEQWQQREKTALPEWFAVIGEMEALNSLGRAAFNHPRWTFPTLTSEPGAFEAVQLGHPLIAETKRVCSNFSSRGLPAVSLITGSNMAGKSTFLRSIGVNQVLALAGFPVCAQSLILENRRIMSSMRIADNLEENASTFYAELSKLKTIIEAVNRNEPVFLLLDEILRGTNSHDRQTGSRALVQQLVRHSAMGVLATHDISLTELASAYPTHIHNYHFDASVEGEELYFDYQLKEGICRSMNASLLMKKIGIEL